MYNFLHCILFQLKDVTHGLNAPLIATKENKIYV